MISDTEKFEIKEGKETLRFEIHKMDAVAGERWLFRAISLVAKYLLYLFKKSKNAKKVGTSPT